MTAPPVVNRLRDETSPYLLQHADNPVHWQAWDDAALTLARESGKPILLSVGYSACHWCHVMAHESFEDAATAQLMNDLYVNIKVDREERPDLDKIYQTAHQLISGRGGGWPLTVFLSPDEHLPIFTGTYFPRERRYGMPSFGEVLVAVESYYRTQADEIRRRGAGLVDALENIAADGGDDFAALSAAPFEAARQRLAAHHDAVHGGFGDAPKFPHPPYLDFLLERWRHGRDTGTPDDAALTMLRRTLDGMAQGGLYDQLGGGFYRYSVDRQWAIPHFEKMLYDNATLLSVYADAHAVVGAPGHGGTTPGATDYGEIASGTADWVRGTLASPDGAFYSTLDADSEHEEGKYYVWTPAGFDALLTPAESALAQRVFGLATGPRDALEVVPPNFEGHAWHLYLAEPLERAAAALDLDAAAARPLLASASAKLLAARAERVPPGRDDKILASWNGLMIGALARASRRLGRPDLAHAATRAVDFLRAQLWRDGRLLSVYKDGRARFPAYLDDHAFLARGLIELLQCRWRADDLAFARALLDQLLERFADPRGGFFFTAADHERLIHRPKPLADEAVPSGNGVAAQALLVLGHLLGESRYLAAAEGTVRAAWHALDRYPDAHATLLHCVAELLEPPTIVVVRAAPAELAAWRPLLDTGFHPHRYCFAIPDDAAALDGALAARAARDGGVAYLCEGSTCRAPLGSRAALEAALTG